jgi:hypothetical protein
VDAISEFKNSLMNSNFNNLDHVMAELESNSEMIEKVSNFN